MDNKISLNGNNCAKLIHLNTISIHLPWARELLGILGLTRILIAFLSVKNDGKAKHVDKNKNTCSVVLGFVMKPPGFSTVE